jgi:membrane protein required for colicin V production
MSFNWFDISLLILVLVSVASGFSAGFARVTIGFVSAIVGLWLAFWSYRIPAKWLQSFIPNTTADNIIGFLIIFVAVAAVGGLVALVLAKLFNWIGLSWFDHLLGGAVGFLRGCVVVAAMVAAIIAFAPSPTPSFLNESAVLPYATSVASAIAQMAPRELKDAFEQQLDNIRHVWKDAQRKLEDNKTLDDKNDQEQKKLPPPREI